MTELDVNVTGLPPNTQGSFREFSQLLAGLAGDNLRAYCAFGGWLIEDPLYHGTPARSVAVLRQFDLRMLDQLGTEGVRFGKKGLGAPLMMTPEYIQASRDVFPLELLEIQQLHAPLCGEDHFTDLTFQRSDVRLQCERELKSELIQMRQGLLAMAGRHEQLPQLCRNGSERTMRVLRGLLHLAGKETPRPSAELVTAAAAATELKLDALTQVVSDARHVDLGGFERFYQDLTTLAGYVDKLEA